jgi:hypothetical protein
MTVREVIAGFLPERRYIMERSDKRVSQPRWRTLSSMAMAFAAVAIVGITSVAPAKADDDDWRYRREWREHHERDAWRERRDEEWRREHPRARIYFSYPAPTLYYESR